jgi:hypothetical protein
MAFNAGGREKLLEFIGYDTLCKYSLYQIQFLNG